MKTTYITFTREMARAYAEGRKRMTRRVLKVRKQGGKMGPPKPPWEVEEDGNLYYQDEYGDYHPAENFCPYGQPGDQLILGTTWAVPKEFDHLKPTELPFAVDGLLNGVMPIPMWSYFDSDEKPVGFGKLRPGLFLPSKFRDRMPRETLKIVRAELLRDITEEDAISEGISKLDHGYFSERLDAKYDSSLPTARLAFANLINRIHGGKNWNLYYTDSTLEKPIWNKNPWVWCIGW